MANTDDPVYRAASTLLDCLNDQFPDSELSTPGNFCFRAGEEISEDIDPITGEDLCCEGLGWVRVGDTFPSSNFPEPDPITIKCFPVGWGQILEVGLLGCYKPGGTPAMADCAQHTEQGVLDMARLRVIKNALCCFGNSDFIKKRGRLWTVTSIAVSGPRGNCISRVAQIVVQIPKCC